MTGLVRPKQLHEENIQHLRTRVAALETALGERSAEFARTRSQLDAFRIRYRREVGRLVDELDALEHAIAEAELGEITKRLEDAGVRSAAAGMATPDSAPRFTSDAVRKLFRDVAKTIHPDLAADDDTRDRRHALMVEANRAYAIGDEARLRMILEAWEKSPESVRGDDPESARLRLERRINQIEEQLAACVRDLAELHDSPLWKLKVMVDEAAARGKDMIADQVRRLTRDISVARHRLDAMLL